MTDYYKYRARSAQPHVGIVFNRDPISDHLPVIGQVNPYTERRIAGWHGRNLAGLGEAGAPMSGEGRQGRYIDPHMLELEGEDDVIGSGIFDPVGRTGTQNPEAGVFASHYNIPGYIARFPPFTVNLDVTDLPSGGEAEVVEVPTGGMAYVERDGRLAGPLRWPCDGRTTRDLPLIPEPPTSTFVPDRYPPRTTVSGAGPLPAMPYMPPGAAPPVPPDVYPGTSYAAQGFPGGGSPSILGGSYTNVPAPVKLQPATIIKSTDASRRPSVFNEMQPARVRPAATSGLGHSDYSHGYEVPFATQQIRVKPSWKHQFPASYPIPIDVPNLEAFPQVPYATQQIPLPYKSIVNVAVYGQPVTGATGGLGADDDKKASWGSYLAGGLLVGVAAGILYGTMKMKK